MNDIPVVSAVHRYLTEAISGRDFAVLSEILVPGYRFDTGGTTLTGRDDTYIPMVSGYLGSEPTIDTAVHELITDGRHVAVWLTKYTLEPRAAWEAVLIYRGSGDGARLERCWSEQDWATRRDQLKGRRPLDDLPPTGADGVWDTSAADPEPAVRAAATAWLTGHPDALAASTPGAAAPQLSDPRVTVNCLVTAGNRFAFHVTHRGGHPEAEQPAELNVAGIGVVGGGTVTCTRAITDSTEMSRRLSGPVSPTASASGR